MSGHSHAKTIKHQKDITDQKRGQMFSKMARLISVAVKEGGPNPETNNKLKIAMETARNFNMPKDNVERAVSRAIGEGGSEKLEEVLFEAYGPGGIAVIIEGITDNKNRALGEVKQILSQDGGKLIGEGGIKWMFSKQGCIIVDSKLQNEELGNKEKLELLAIESGAEDLSWRENYLQVYTKPEDLDKIRRTMEEKNIKLESYSLNWEPKEEIELDEKQRTACQKLFEDLDESDSVQNVYSNLKE